MEDISCLWALGSVALIQSIRSACIFKNPTSQMLQLRKTTSLVCLRGSVEGQHEIYGGVAGPAWRIGHCQGIPRYRALVNQPKSWRRRRETADGGFSSFLQMSPGVVRLSELINCFGFFLHSFSISILLTSDGKAGCSLKHLLMNP